MMGEASGQSELEEQRRDLAVLQRLPELAMRIGYVDVYLLYGVLHLRSDALRRELDVCAKPLRTFVQLFALGESVEAANLDDILNAEERGALIRLGLLLPKGTLLSTGGMTLIPILGHLAFVPTPAHNPVAYFSDDVAGLLSRLGPPFGATGLALNLHAGAGLSSLVAAARCEKVIAVERGQLARACIELNVVMNRQSDRIEVHDESSFAAQYAESRFSYLFANTPLLPVPERLFLQPGHLHGASSELSPAAQVLQSVPRLLHPRGRAQIVGADLGNAHEPALCAQLAELARVHQLKIVMTLPGRAELMRDTHVLHALTWACHSLTGLTLDNARDRLLFHLGESGHHTLYLFYITASFDAQHSGLVLNRFDTIGKGFWFRYA